MAKRFHDISGAHDNAALEKDFEAAEKFDCFSVGDIGVYYRDGFRIKLIPYDRTERVFIREQEVNGRMCCGSTVFRYYRIVFICGGKEIADAISEDEKAVFAAFEKIKEKAPELHFGVKR